MCEFTQTAFCCQKIKTSLHRKDKAGKRDFGINSITEYKNNATEWNNGPTLNI